MNKQKRVRLLAGVMSLSMALGSAASVLPVYATEDDDTQVIENIVLAEGETEGLENENQTEGNPEENIEEGQEGEEQKKEEEGADSSEGNESEGEGDNSGNTEGESTPTEGGNSSTTDDSSSTEGGQTESKPEGGQEGGSEDDSSKTEGGSSEDHKPEDENSDLTDQGETTKDDSSEESKTEDSKVEEESKEEKPEEEKKEDKKDKKDKKKKEEKKEEEKKDEEEEEKKVSIGAYNPNLFGKLEIPEIIRVNWRDADGEVLEKAYLPMWKNGKNAVVNFDRSADAEAAVYKVELKDANGEKIHSELNFDDDSATFTASDLLFGAELNVYTSIAKETKWAVPVRYNLVNRELVDKNSKVGDFLGKKTVLQTSSEIVKVVDNGITGYEVSFSTPWQNKLGAKNITDGMMATFKKMAKYIDVKQVAFKKDDKVILIPYDALLKKPEKVFKKLSFDILVPVNVKNTSAQIRVTEASNLTYTMKIAAGVDTFTIPLYEEIEDIKDYKVIVNGEEISKSSFSFDEKTNDLTIKKPAAITYSVEIEPPAEEEESRAVSANEYIAKMEKYIEKLGVEKKDEDRDISREAWIIYCIEQQSKRRNTIDNVSDMTIKENAEAFSDIFWAMNKVTLKAKKNGYKATLKEVSKFASYIDDRNWDAEQIAFADKAMSSDWSLATIANESACLVHELPVWPIANNQHITTEFMEADAIYGRAHRGMDIGAGMGTDILAIKSGTVVRSGWNNSYGWFVKIEHVDGSSTLYAHMSKRKVEEGDTVAAGDIIGYVGSTGDSTGPHLHLEWAEDGKLINPLDCVREWTPYEGESEYKR